MALSPNNMFLRFLYADDLSIYLGSWKSLLQMKPHNVLHWHFVYSLMSLVFIICFIYFTSENLFMWDISATAELNAVHCVTGSFLRNMKRAGRGVLVPVGCEIFWQNWHLDDGYLKRHSRLWERRIICLVLHKTLSDTTQGFHLPPMV